MRKIIAILCAILLTAGLFAFPASAAATRIDGAPDWLITEVCANPEAYLADGVTNAGDIYEFLELFNNSGKTLNLYDYCLTYNGTAPNGTGFERAITEITPLAVEWLDKGEGTYALTADMPGNNPEDTVGSGTYSIAPGEVVVVWFFNGEGYAETVKDLVSVDDFRTFWKLEPSVKVVVLDANSSGADRNFNIKNSATGTYGIANYNATTKANLDAISNVKGAGTNYDGLGYFETDVMVAWATVFCKDSSLNGDKRIGQLESLPNDNTAVQFRYVPVAGKRMVAYALEASTPGKLNDAQKADIAAGGYVGTGIATAAQFKAAMENDPAGIYYLKDNIDFGGETFDGKVFDDFSGILDGRGYALFNYKIVSADGAKADGGTFATLAVNGCALLANVFFGKPTDKLQITFKLTGGSQSYGAIAGAQTGKAGSVRFVNVHVYADITLDTTDKCNVAGFIGYGRKFDATDSSMNGSVVVGNAASTTYVNSAGFFGSVNADRNYILDCINTANVTVIKSTSEARAAGLVTYTGKTLFIKGCRNEGIITAGEATDDPATYDNIAAGIIATVNSTGSEIIDCINAGQIVSNDTAAAIVAQVNKASATLKVDNCDNFVAVTGLLAGVVSDELINVGPAADVVLTTDKNDKYTAGTAAPQREALPIPKEAPPTGDNAVYFGIVAVAVLAVAGVALTVKKKEYNV